jgi:photosystem II stability/assembly factor-like uncharacterized protein
MTLLPAMRRATTGAAVRSLAFVLFVPALALAHGTPAQTLSVSTRPGVENDLLVSSTFGAIVSHDRGASWRVICEEAIGYGTGQRPAWLLSASGAMFAGSFKGLFVARDGGCDWQTVPEFEVQGCADVQQRGGTMLAVQGKYSLTDANGILRSTDDGHTWSRSAEESKVLFYSSVRLAPSNPMRAYVAAWWFQPNVSLLLRSDDDGQTFTTKDVSAALPAVGAFYVLAVHPTKPGTLFVTVTRDAEPKTSWLLKSTDDGDTFTPVVTAVEIFNSVAFGPDPSVVYAASGNALYRSSDEGATFELLAVPSRNACVATSGAHVYGCGLQELDGFVVGQATSGKDFSSLMRWSSIAGPQTCPASSMVTTLCEPLWPVVQSTFPIEPSDGGPPDAGEADAGHDPPIVPKPCGCSAASGPMLLGLALMLRRRSGVGAPPSPGK